MLSDKFFFNFVILCFDFYLGDESHIKYKCMAAQNMFVIVVILKAIL